MVLKAVIHKENWHIIGNGS